MNFQHVPNMAQLRIGNFYVDKNGFLRIQQDATLQPGCSSDFAHSEVNVPNEDRQVEASNVEILTKSTENDIPPLDLTKYTKKGLLRKRKMKQPKESSDEKSRKLAEKHPVLSPCLPTCHWQCTENFTDEERHLINQKYWSMNYENKSAFVKSLCIRENPKRPNESAKYNRTTTVKYHFRLHTGNQQRICRTFFLTTLGYPATNDKIVRRIINLAEKNSVSPVKDGRGRQAAYNKVDRDVIAQHVESFHPTISHYRREHAPNVRYLPSDVTIKFMHEDFSAKHAFLPVSYELYRDCVKKMKIHFTKLGHEECEKCEMVDLHHPQHGQQNLDPECSDCLLWQSHIKNAELSRKLYREHAETKFKNNEICVSADLQKVIMLPPRLRFHRIPSKKNSMKTDGNSMRKFQSIQRNLPF